MKALAWNARTVAEGSHRYFSLMEITHAHRQSLARWRLDDPTAISSGTRYDAAVGAASHGRPGRPRRSGTTGVKPARLAALICQYVSIPKWLTSPTPDAHDARVLPPAPISVVSIRFVRAARGNPMGPRTQLWRSRQPRQYSHHQHRRPRHPPLDEIGQRPVRGVERIGRGAQLDPVLTGEGEELARVVAGVGGDRTQVRSWNRCS